VRAVVVAGVVTLALHALRLIDGSTFYGLDFTRCDVGFICAIREGLAQGDSLFMNPFIGNGTPLALAPEAQLFSVVRWLSLVFSPDLAGSVGVIVHLALAASATTALVLTFGVTPLVAALAGVCAALSGPFIDLTFHGMYIAGAVALPLTWASARSTLRRRSADARVLVGVAGGLAFALLGGEPQAAAIALTLVLVEVAFTVWSRRRERARLLERLAPLALASTSGLLIGSWPWWGTLAEMVLTHRDRALAIGEALRWDIGPAHVLGMVLPGLTTVTHASARTLFGELFPTTPSGWIPEPYLGLLLLTFVVVGLFTRRARGSSAPVVAGFGFMAALGSHTPFMPTLVSLLPALASFRFPAKYLVVTTLALIVLAAIGADRIARRPRAAHRALVAVSACVATAAFFVLAPAQLFDLDDVVLMHMRTHAIAETGIAAAALAITAIPRARPFVLVVLALDLGLVSTRVIETGPALAPQRSVGEVVHSVVDRDIPVVCMTQPLRMSRYLDDPSWRRGQSRFFRTWLVNDLQACDSLSSAIPYSVLATRVHHALSAALDQGSLHAARALACDVVVSDVALDDPGAPLVILDGDGVRTPPAPEDESTRARAAARLTLVPDPRDDVTIARAATLQSSEAALVARLVSATSAKESTALIDDPLSRLSSPALPDGAGVTHLELKSPRSDEATFTIDGAGGAVVVWRRAFAVGWTARQAGETLPVVRASGTSVAVVVDDVTRGPVTLAYVMPRRTLAHGALIVGLLLLLAVEWLSRALSRALGRR